MGLHRDPTTYSTSPIEIQVRRLVWYQICFLDIRTCEATGPRPQIRPDDYDTQYPLNIDDIDLDRAESGDESVNLQEDRPYFTDMTISRMRFECYEMHRFLWNERPKLDKKKVDEERKVTVTSLLARIQTFKAAMEKTYLPMLSKSNPLHALASEMYGITSNRLYIAVLQKYITSDQYKMPDRLRQVMLSAAVMILEHSMAIEQPALAPWSWYIGALHQYQVAMLITNEWSAIKGDPVMEQRIWKVLDFSFNLPSGMSSNDKLRMILEDMVEKTQAYASMKRWRAPITMPQPGPWMHTPGVQEKQRKEREDKERSASVQSAETSNEPVETSVDENSSTPHVSPPPQPYHQPYQQYQPYQTQNQTIKFPGAIPVVAWGTFDAPTPTTNIQHQTSNPEPHKLSDYAPPTSVMSLMPTSVTTQHQDRNPSSAGIAMPSFGSADIINEIDLVGINRPAYIY